MAFTKITAAGIGTTQPLELTGVNLSGVVTATGLYVTGISTFTGNVSIAGTLTYEDVTNIDAVGLITARAGIEFGTRPGLGASISDIGNAVFAGVVTATSYYGDGSNLTGISVDSTQIVTGDTSVQTSDTGSDGTIKFNTDGSERARIDNSGHILAGTSTVRKDFFNFSTAYGPRILSELSGNVDAFRISYAAVRNSDSTDSGFLVFGKSRGTSNGSTTIVQSGDALGEISFQGADGSELVTGASIKSEVDGTPGANDMPGRLVFSTTSDGVNYVTERMRIDSQGRMGLGTASPAFDSGNGIHINDSTESSIHFTNSTVGTTSTDGAYIGYNSNALLLRNTELGATIRFQTYNAERARIDGSGRLLVGTTSARSDFFNGAAPAQFQTEIAASSGLVNACFINNGGGAGVIIGRSNGSSVGSNTIVSNGDSVGYLDFQAADGNNFEMVARIEALVDGTPGNNDMPGSLVFSTTSDGATNSTERYRINSSGQFTHTGATTTILSGSPGRSFALGNSNSAPQSCTIQVSSYGNQSVYSYISDITYNNHFLFTWRGNAAGSITSPNAASVSYNSNSDYRLKENVVPLTGAIDRLSQLQVHRFNFIIDPDRTVDGFIAHEAQAVVPECATGTKDEVEVWQEGEELPDGVSVGDNKLDEDGNTIPVYQGIDQSKLVPLLTAALQEAIAKIETLETKVAALEAN